jgi:ubiquitin C-terminal hydrolase
MNSILHILQQIPLFLLYITFAKFRETLLNKTDDVKSNVIFELFRLFKTSAENNDIIITPTTFKRLIGEKNNIWKERRQQDSQEFFNFLITQIEEEIGTKCKFIPSFKLSNNNLKLDESIDTPSFKLSNNNLKLDESIDNILASSSWVKFQAKEYSPLKNMFDGLTKITKRCVYCNNKNSIFEPFISLGLEVRNNIYDCLDNLVSEEQLDSSNKVICNFCGLKNKSVSNTLLWKTPDILVLHLKRFIVNAYGIPIQKNNENIDYPITDLDLSKYIDPASPHKNKTYELVGVNIHHGYTINSGHYTSYVKNIINKKWYHYNDSQPITEIKNIQNQNAYILFYQSCQN